LCRCPPWRKTNPRYVQI